LFAFLLLVLGRSFRLGFFARRASAERFVQNVVPIGLV